MNSLTFLENIKLQTYDPVSIQSNYWVVKVLKNLMVRSAVPPPEANKPCLCGDQAIALTAAWCWLNLANGIWLPILQTNSLLSLPPDAN